MVGANFCNPSAAPVGRSNLRNSKAPKLRASLPGLPPASKIFIRNLSYSTNETSLRKEFSAFGQIVDVKLIKDEGTKRSKGYAFVQYSSQEAAMLAMEQMDSKLMDDRTVYVELAKPLHKPFAGCPRSSGPPAEGSS